MEKTYIKPAICAISTEPVMLVEHSNDYAEGKPGVWIEEEEEEAETTQSFWGLEKTQKGEQLGATQWDDNW